MALRFGRPCRGLARQQLRALIEVHPSAPRASAAALATNSSRQFHQTAPRRREEAQPIREPSAFAQTVAKFVHAVTPENVALPYRVFGATDAIYKICSAPAKYTISEELRKKEDVPMTKDGEEIGVGGGVWHDEFGLLPTFSTWSQVTMLHLYLVVVRLRCLDKSAWHTWQTQLVNHFFQHAEDTMQAIHGMTTRTSRSANLDVLFTTWRGVLLSYDEGLIKGDAVMAAAVWRNVFRSQEDVDMRHVAAVVSFMRRSIKKLDQMMDPVLLYPPSSHSHMFDVLPTAELAFVDQPVSLEEVKALSAESVSA